MVKTYRGALQQIWSDGAYWTWFTTWVLMGYVSAEGYLAPRRSMARALKGLKK